MKNGLIFIIRVLSILAALSAIIFSIAVFRYEIEEFFGFLGERFSKLCGKCNCKDDDEYADFADV